jgi:hypothetical protein
LPRFAPSVLFRMLINSSMKIKMIWIIMDGIFGLRQAERTFGLAQLPHPCFLERKWWAPVPCPPATTFQQSLTAWQRQQHQHLFMIRKRHQISQVHSGPKTGLKLWCPKMRHHSFGAHNHIIDHIYILYSLYRWMDR